MKRTYDTICCNITQGVNHAETKNPLNNTAIQVSSFTSEPVLQLQWKQVGHSI